ncbi:MAG: hypothetical protein U0V48_11750 [Anaerolineales bacterium]
MNSSKPESFKAIPAFGVVGKLPITNYQIVIGSSRLMSAEGLEMPDEIGDQARTWKEAGRVVVYAGWEGRARHPVSR